MKEIFFDDIVFKIPIISFEDIGTITELDTDRCNIIDFLSSRDMNFFGKGFNSIVQDYQQYLTKEINEEMYLTNRVLPNYLNDKVSTQNFGTGRLFINFYKSSKQISLLIRFLWINALIIILLLLNL